MNPRLNVASRIRVVYPPRATTFNIVQDGFTLLHCAATGGHEDAVQVILDAGLDVDAIDKVSMQFTDV